MFIDDLDHVSFAEWLIQLNAYAAEAGYKTGRPLTHLTGQLCWYHFYEDRMTPNEAIETMIRDAIEFGADYLD
jgi:hypothetical protein